MRQIGNIVNLDHQKKLWGGEGYMNYSEKKSLAPGNLRGKKKSGSESVASLAQ